MASLRTSFLFGTSLGLSLCLLPACFSFVGFDETCPDPSSIEVKINGLPENGYLNSSHINLEVRCGAVSCDDLSCDENLEPRCFLTKESDSKSLTSIKPCSQDLSGLVDGESYRYTVNLGKTEKAKAEWKVDITPPNLVIKKKKMLSKTLFEWHLGVQTASKTLSRHDLGSPISFSYCGSLRSADHCDENWVTCPSEYCQPESDGGFRVTHPLSTFSSEGKLYLGALARDLAGHEAQIDDMIPFRALPLSRSSVAVGEKASCAIHPEDEDSLSCWGDLNWMDQQINVESSSSSIDLTPLMLTDDFTHCAVVGAYGKFCALVAKSGEPCPQHPLSIAKMDLYCWGDELILEDGNLEPKLSSSAAKKVEVPGGGAAWHQISLGQFHTCGITDDQKLYCWGDNRDGQIGTGTASAALLFDSPQRIEHPEAEKRFRQVATGRDYSCALDSHGQVWCFGAARRGLAEMASGWSWGTSPTQLERPMSAGSSSAEAEACEVQVTERHVFVRFAMKGKCKVAGDQQLHYVPLGSTEYRPIEGIDPTQIKAQAGTFCYLNSKWYCLGENEWGQWGSLLPPAVVQLDEFDQASRGYEVYQFQDRFQVTELALSSDHYCALSEVRSNGAAQVYCAGDNAFGQSALKRPVSLSAVKVVRDNGAADWSFVSAGRHHTCAVAGTGASGTLYCWGRNWKGQSGVVRGANTNAPKEMPSMNCPASTFSSVSAGGQGTLAIAAPENSNIGALCGWSVNGALLAKGSEAQFADSASGFEISVDRFQELDTNPEEFRQVQLSDRHACAITNSTESVYCWGYSGSRQIVPGNSNSDYEPSSESEKITRITKQAYSVALGHAHSCIKSITASQSAVDCYGVNFSGQLGYGDDGHQQYSFGDANWGLVAGDNFTCGYPDQAGGDIHCFGQVTEDIHFDPGTNELPNKSQNAPFDVIYWSGQAAGAEHVCFLSGVTTSTQSLYCMGSNRNGQLGLRESAQERLHDKRTFVKAGLDDLGPIQEISAGGQHTCILNTDHEIHCWGSNAYGQLGDPSLDWNSHTAQVIDLHQ